MCVSRRTCWPVCRRPTVFARYEFRSCQLRSSQQPAGVVATAAASKASSLCPPPPQSHSYVKKSFPIRLVVRSTFYASHRWRPQMEGDSRRSRPTGYRKAAPGRSQGGTSLSHRCREVGFGVGFGGMGDATNTTSRLRVTALGQKHDSMS